MVAFAMFIILSLTTCRAGIEGDGSNSGDPTLSAPSSDNSASGAASPSNTANPSFVDSSMYNADTSRADTTSQR